MQVEPFQYVPECPLGEIPMHDAGGDLDDYLIFSIDCVEMRRWMFARENPDHYA